jgi:hypothetical protein
MPNAGGYVCTERSHLVCMHALIAGASSGGIGGLGSLAATCRSHAGGHMCVFFTHCRCQRWWACLCWSCACWWQRSVWRTQAAACSTSRCVGLCMIWRLAPGCCKAWEDFLHVCMSWLDLKAVHTSEWLLTEACLVLLVCCRWCWTSSCLCARCSWVTYGTRGLLGGPSGTLWTKGSLLSWQQGERL